MEELRVPAQSTPSDVLQVLEAEALLWEEVFEETPKKQPLIVLAAHSALETGATHDNGG